MIPLSIAASKLIRSLHQKKYRSRERKYIAEGVRLLEEFSRHNHKPEFVYGIPAMIEELTGLFPDIPCYSIPNASQAYFATDHPQGVGAVMSMPESPGLDYLNHTTPYLFLNGISDPGNLGSIIRTCAWFGMNCVLMDDQCVDPYNPKCVRSTMGALVAMRCIEGVQLDQLSALQRPIIGLDAVGETSINDDSIPGTAILVVGSEAHGLSEDVIKICQKRVSIPGMGSTVESLNASVAAGIACYELRRRQLLR